LEKNIVQSLDALTGRQFGEFLVLERVGRGGMATVYRAKQQSISRDVALKVIDLRVASENKHDDFEKRFANEAEIIASLEHIHILPVYAYGIQDEMAYLAMRLLKGGSMKALIRQHVALPMELAMHLFRQVADGLAYAHSKGIIHRDLKPANVLLDDEGNAFLTDFGLAKWINTEGDITKQGVIVGTLTYMSPEHLRGEKLDQRTDIYSMGIMLYEMLCGHPPFSNELGEDMVGVVYKHLEYPPPSLCDANPAISTEVESVVMKALAKKRDDRYHDMNEFVRAMNDAIGSGTTASIPSIFANSPAPESAPSSVSISAPSAVSQPIASAVSQAVASGISQPVTVPIPARNTRLWVFLAIALGVVLGVGVMMFLLQQNAPIPPFDILHGERMLWSETIPSEQDIRTAQRALGEGFVAIVACNATSEYHTTLTREITSRLREYQLAFNVYDSQNDPYIQRTEMEKALTEGAGAFIICPLNYAIIDPTLVAIQDLKLPMALYSAPDNNTVYEGVYTSSEGSNYEMGQAVGQVAGAYVRDVLNGEANVVILDFPDMQVIVERANGMEDALRAIAPSVKIVGRFIGGTRENGKDSLQALLDEKTEFDVILSINDAGSIGAINALEEAKIPHDAVSIFSVDAEELAVDYMRKGEYMRGTLEVGRTQTAHSTVDAVTRMLAGATVAEKIYIPLLTVLTPETLAP
jgi:serine/threonine protein kinase/ABC-type sugar transport system substrate-binding protein